MRHPIEEIMRSMKYSFSKSMKWSVLITILTFFLAAIFTVGSTVLLEGLAWGMGMLIVLILVLIGIIFDMMGLAAAAAKETPFHAMASEKVRGSRQALGIIRNADRFSNICNDVIGDIAGIISGAATAIVVIKLMMPYPDLVWMKLTVSVVFTALVSALTVGGKAFGKSISLSFSTPIVLMIGKVFYVLEHRLGIRFFSIKKKAKKISKFEAEV